MKVTAFVTIKLNSERLPNKNILPLGKHPLSWHICQTLLECKLIDDICIYCSEEKIMNYVPKNSRLRLVKRSPKLDGNLVKAQEVYDSFVNDVKADIYVAALTTAPFLSSASIDNGIRQIIEHGHDSSFSAQKFQTFAWFEGKPINYNPSDIPRTQDMNPVYIESSGFFAFTHELWTSHKRRIGFNPYIQEISLFEATDIDTKEDYEHAKELFAIRKGE